MSNKFLCYANRIFYMIFQKIFKFGKWHANAPFYCRPYKKKVVDIINDLKPVTIIEIGCGLGEIISRVNARNKYGIDIDANAIKFGALLARNVTFINGSFDAIYKIPEKHIDVLVLINWTHGLEPAFIKKEIYNLLKNKKIVHLVIDEILQQNKTYKYHHKFSKILKRRFHEVKSFDDPEKIRNVKVLKCHVDI